MLRLFGCFPRLLIAGVMVAGLVVAVRHQGELRSAWRDLTGREEAAADSADPELASSAEAKIEGLADEGGPPTVTLSEGELQSLLEYRFGGFLPDYVTEPRIELREGRVRGHARVATDRIAGVSESAELLALLPDTTTITVTGQLIPVDGRRVALAVDDISAARVPLPRRLIPQLLDRLGRPPGASVQPDAWALPLPRGATDAFVRGDSLFLLTRGRRDGRR